MACLVFPLLFCSVAVRSLLSPSERSKQNPMLKEISGGFLWLDSVRGSAAWQTEHHDVHATSSLTLCATGIYAAGKGSLFPSMWWEGEITGNNGRCLG